MIPTIKLMPDYGCYCLWWVKPFIGNIDYVSLPISKKLYHELIALEEEFDATMNTEYSYDIKEESEEEIDEFEQKLIKVWQNLQKELEGKYVVGYHSFKHNKDIYSLN